MKRIPLIAGNWKLNIIPSEVGSLINPLVKAKLNSDVEVLVCPPYVSLAAAKSALNNTPIKLGAQDIYFQDKGAYTGQISGPFLKDIGCEYVIVGHSERRQYFNETDENINKKIFSAYKNGLIPIVCVGETLEERENEKTFEVIERQLKGCFQDLSKEHASIVVAYEPVWAIGTGKTATPQQAQEVHAFIRNLLRTILAEKMAEGIRILYGGSVKPDNVKELMSKDDIDGALVGGASLKVDSFIKLINYKK